MKRCLILGLMFLAMGGVAFAHSTNTGPLVFDFGIPILYTNSVDVFGAFSSFNNLTSTTSTNAFNSVRDLPLMIVSNLRTGAEFDFLLNVVPDVLGIGVNTAVLLSYGFHPNAPVDRRSFLIDIPMRAAVRIGLGETGYIQVHSGIYLQNIIEAIRDSAFSVFRYVDVGLRIQLGSIAFVGGYLIEVMPPPIGGDLIPNPKIPFYAGLFIPVI